MSNFLGRYINIYTLGAINLLIILLTVSSGSVYLHNGNVHLMAIIFAVIAVPLFFMAVKILFSDKYLKVFFRIIFLVLIVFSASHIMEYLVSQELIPVNHKAGDAFVLFLYLFSIVMIAASTEFLLGLKASAKKWSYKFLFFIASIIAVSSLYVLLADLSVDSLSRITSPLIPFLVVIGFFTLYSISKLKKAMPVLANFLTYFTLTVVFTLISSVFEYLEQVGIGPFTELQNAYMTHFAIYIAVSFYILGLVKLLNPTGIYKDMQAFFTSA